MIKRRVHLTFPTTLITEPVIWKLGHEFKIITNIRRANVSTEAGSVDMELDGEEAEIERGIDWLKKKGVRVDPIVKDIVE